MPTPILDLLPLVLPYLPGCPEISAEAALREAAIDFCERALVVQKVLPAITPTQGATRYELTLDPDERVAKLLSAKCNGRPLSLTTPAGADDAPDSLGPVAAVYLAGPRALGVYPTPAAAGAAITPRVAIKPARTATTLPDDLVEDYAADIAQGAIARCAMEPGQPYTNAEVAGAASAVFEGRITKAKVDAFNANSRADQRVPPMWF